MQKNDWAILEVALPAIFKGLLAPKLGAVAPFIISGKHLQQAIQSMQTWYLIEYRT